MPRQRLPKHFLRRKKKMKHEIDKIIEINNVPAIIEQWITIMLTDLNVKTRYNYYKNLLGIRAEIDRHITEYQRKKGSML